MLEHSIAAMLAMRASIESLWLSRQRTTSGNRFESDDERVEFLPVGGASRAAERVEWTDRAFRAHQ